jgi:hypothetical protein
MAGKRQLRTTFFPSFSEEGNLLEPSWITAPSQEGHN